MSRAGSPIEWIYCTKVGRNVSEILCQIKAFQHVKATESHTFRLAAGQANPETGTRPGGQGLESLETRGGLQLS